ncbi:MAG: peptidoglycan DD-metalloendopeptidase family protein [Bacteriovorax sp.]|nr:peptidoglycan DD-metalloendopeptidase family protein [Bacteriovorax sp.]
MYPEKHPFKKRYCFASIATKHGLLNLSLLFCILLSSCNAIKEATNRAQLQKPKDQKDTTSVCVSAFEQVSPIKGKVISPFGYRGNHKHTGADIKLQKGDTVRAAYCGKVTKACSYSGYGNLVILKHSNNIETYYSHLSKCLVQVGDTVVAGAVVGLGGRTGRATTDHLHFEVRFNSVAHNPEDFFDFSTGAVKIPFIAYSPVTKTRTVQSTTNAPITTIHFSDHSVTVKKGDTLYALARQHGTTVKQIQELNNLGNTMLKVGMKLKVK